MSNDTLELISRQLEAIYEQQKVIVDLLSAIKTLIQHPQIIIKNTGFAPLGQLEETIYPEGTDND